MPLVIQNQLKCSIEEKEGILEEFGRTFCTFQEDVEAVQKWLKKMPHLPQNVPQKTIETFLILNKCSVERAKKKIENYFCLMSEHFTASPASSPKVKEALDVMFFLPLPKLYKKRRIFICKLLNSNPEALSMENFTCSVFRICDIIIREDCFSGGINIIDLKGFEPAHLPKFDFGICKQNFWIMEHVYSSRLYGLHFLNAPSIFEMGLKMVKSFMKQKLIERIYVHNSLEDLHQIVPKEILPEDFGGLEKPFAEHHKIWKQILIDYEPCFQEMRKFKIDPKLKPEIANDEILGYQGNFRKLNVD